MLRRELIMVEPYRQLRFHGHRRRVASASAVVDSGPPVRPRHVVDPSRRLAERRQLQWRHLDADIRLMRALADIMDSKRLDNDNTDFEKYRRLLQGSRTRSVDRTTPLPPDLFPATDHRGKPLRRSSAAPPQLRLCQMTAARPRSHSSPSPSPLDQWPDEWLLRHRQQRQQQQQQQKQQQQQQEQQQQQRRRRRRCRGSQPRQVADKARSSGCELSAPQGRALSRPVHSGPDSDGSDRDSEGDADGSDGDADESDGDADESDASEAGDRYLAGSDENGADLCRVPPQSADLYSDPEAQDRLRRHGMVLMKGTSRCQCSARRLI